MDNEIAKVESTLTKKEIAQSIATEESFDALNTTLDIIKEEYGDYTLTQEMRQELAKELGESEECAKGWQKVADILDHVDMNELAKKHPEKVAKVSKAAAGIIGAFFPVAARVANAPDDFHAKIVGFAGALTPEHLINLFAKSQIKRKKAKQEKEQAAAPEAIESAPAHIPDAQTDTVLLPQEEDIITTIKKLSELKDCGILTQEEFDAKKAELLKRL